VIGAEAEMVSGLTEADVQRIFRTATGAALGIAVVAVAAGGVFGHLLIGVGAAAGLVLGILNAYGVRSMATKVSAVGARKRFAVVSSMRRLGLITVVVFGLVLVNKYAGLAALAGLGLFQMFTVVASSGAMLRALKEGSRQ
jgi:hypothetical protein